MEKFSKAIADRRNSEILLKYLSSSTEIGFLQSNRTADTFLKEYYNNNKEKKINK